MMFLSLKGGVDFLLKLRLKFKPIPIPLKLALYLKQYFAKTFLGSFWFCSEMRKSKAEKAIKMKISCQKPKKYLAAVLTFR
jgi:hypothetical protein